MNWDDYKVFTAIDAAGTVRGAARALDINPSTVSRRLEQFEQRLGVSLFLREPSGLVLTPEGRAVADRARRVASELGEIEASLQGMDQRPGGPIRLEVPDALMMTFFAPALAAFSAEHPDISLHLVPAARRANVGQREVDVAIRITDAPELDLAGQPLGRFGLAAYALAERAQPTRWLGWVEGSPLHASSEIVRKRDFPSLPVHHTVGNVIGQQMSARAGLGVAALPCVLGDHDPALQRVGGDPVEGPMLWLLMHPDLRRAARVQALNASIRAVFTKQVDSLLGRAKISG